MTAHDSERRKDSRRTHASLIEYAAAAKGNPAQESRGKGVTINVSASGLCIYLFHPLQEGFEIRIYRGLFARKPLLAEVRWAKPVTEGIYKAGLMFFGSGAASSSGGDALRSGV